MDPCRVLNPNWMIVPDGTAIAYLFSLKNTPEQMAAGAEIFISVCSQCHGENGQGNGPEASTVRVPPADFTDQSVMAAISNQDMVNVLVNGLGESMPAFGNMLSDDKRWAVTNYIRSLSFKPVEQAVVPTGSTPLVPAASSTLDAAGTPSSGDRWRRHGHPRTPGGRCNREGHE